MPDKYDQMIDAALSSSGRDKYDDLIDSALGAQTQAQPMRDAVAQPPVNPDFEVQGRSQPAMGGVPSYRPEPIMPGPGLDISPTRALLTNEPTSGYIESTLRGVPAQLGALVAGGSVAGVGIAASPFTGGLSLPAGAGASIVAAGAGAAGMEGARQTAAQLYSAASGRPYSPPSQVIGNVGMQATMGALGQAGSEALKAGGKFAGDRLPAFIEHYFGPQSSITRYIQSRGAGKVLTNANMEPDAPMNALEQARGAIVGGRKAAGSAVGAAEDALIESGALGQPLNVSDIAVGLRQELTKKGLIGPDAAALKPGQKKTLEYIVERLEGGVSGSEAVQLKRMLGDMIDTSGGRIPEVGSTAAGLIRRTTGQLAGRINTTHPTLGQANELAQKVIQVYDRYRKYLGQMGDEAFSGGDDALQMVADAGALRRVRSALASNPKVPAGAVAEFDQAVEGAGAAIQQVFDSTAANMFNGAKAGRGAPSNIFLKGASSIGLTSPYMAGQLLRGAEAAAKVNPIAASYRVVAAVANPAANSALADFYARQQP